MNRNAALLMALLSLTALPATAQDAPKQTVEGAHRFLSMLAEQGNMKIELFNQVGGLYEIAIRGTIIFNAQEGRSYVGGAKTREQGAYSALKPVALSYVAKTKCSADFKLDSATLDAHRRNYENEIMARSNQSEYVDRYDLRGVPPQKPVDWTKVPGLKRDNKGSDVTITGIAKLAFPSEELAVRAQYAMEFIRNACDATASTGF